MISVIEVSFLVGFLAYFESLILCADLVEAVDDSWGQPTLTLTSEMT